ncbi:hypothetical protein [Malacoplasma penetrans]|nr:hypothetical protein [Malacoplasma penetrans]
MKIKKSKIIGSFLGFATFSALPFVYSSNITNNLNLVYSSLESNNVRNAALTWDTLTNEDRRKLMANYIEHFSENQPLNVNGTCSFITIMGMIGFYDTFFNDDLVTENYDVSTTYPFQSVTETSPGFLGDREIKWTQSGQSITEYTGFGAYAKALKHKEDTSFNSVIMQSMLDAVPGSQYMHGAGRLEYRKAFDRYFENYVGLQEGVDYTYEFNRLDDLESQSQEKQFNWAKSKIDQGIPVFLAISGSTGGHGVVAYDYNESTKELIFNAGWNKNKGDTLNSIGYTKYGYAFVINFSDKLKSKYSNNYLKKTVEDYEVKTSTLTYEELLNEIDNNKEKPKVEFTQQPTNFQDLKYKEGMLNLVFDSKYEFEVTQNNIKPVSLQSGSVNGSQKYILLNTANKPNDGNWKIKVYDKNNPSSSTEYTFAVDHTAPTILINNTSVNGTAANTLTYDSATISWNDKDVKRATYSFNGGQEISFKKGTTFAVDGTYKIKLTDDIGNVSEKTINIKNDKKYGVVTESGQPLNLDSITSSNFKVTSGNSGYKIVAKKDNQSYEYNFDQLISEPGLYSFEIIDDKNSSVKKFGMTLQKSSSLFSVTHKDGKAVKDKDVINSDQDVLVKVEDNVNLTITKDGKSYPYRLDENNNLIIRPDGSYILTFEDLNSGQKYTLSFVIDNVLKYNLESNANPKPTVESLEEDIKKKQTLNNHEAYIYFDKRKENMNIKIWENNHSTNLSWGDKLGNHGSYYVIKIYNSSKEEWFRFFARGVFNQEMVDNGPWKDKTDWVEPPVDPNKPVTPPVDPGPDKPVIPPVNPEPDKPVTPPVNPDPEKPTEPSNPNVPVEPNKPNDTNNFAKHPTPDKDNLPFKFEGLDENNKSKFGNKVVISSMSNANNNFSVKLFKDGKQTNYQCGQEINQAGKYVVTFQNESGTQYSYSFEVTNSNGELIAIIIGLSVAFAVVVTAAAIAIVLQRKKYNKRFASLKR